MADATWLGARFEEQRPRLTALARRMLGSATEAEDAVQEAWLRLRRTDGDAIENLGAWLTTVVSRICLNQLQARRSHAEVPLDAVAADRARPEPAGGADPEGEALLAESVGLALLVVLDRLTPAERVAFVLHDTFGMPFPEIARILQRTVPATRQLASRARRRVRQGEAAQHAERLHHDRVVDAFIAAVRAGDVARLVALLAPDVLMEADATAVGLGAAAQTRGAEPAAAFARLARGVRPVNLDGWAAAAWMPGGRPRVVLRFTVREGTIRRIEVVADPAQLERLNPVPLQAR